MATAPTLPSCYYCDMQIQHRQLLSSMSNCYYADRVYSCKRNVMVWHHSVSPSVCLTHQQIYRDSPGATCDAASVHFGPTIRRTYVFMWHHKNVILSADICYVWTFRLSALSDIPCAAC